MVTHIQLCSTNSYLYNTVLPWALVLFQKLLGGGSFLKKKALHPADIK